MYNNNDFVYPFCSSILRSLVYPKIVMLCYFRAWLIRPHSTTYFVDIFTHELIHVFICIGSVFFSIKKIVV